MQFKSKWLRRKESGGTGGVICSPGLWASKRRLPCGVLKEFQGERGLGQGETNVGRLWGGIQHL